MKQYRKQLIHWLFKQTMITYCRFKKKEPWGITVAQLLQMPRHSFGFYLGDFLRQHNFQLIPKVERHDAYHLVTGFSTSVEDEIALQYACFGNGKRTPYLYGVLLLGTLILPDYFTYYCKAYQFGKRSHSFHHYNFKQILPLDFRLFKAVHFHEKDLKDIQELQRHFSEKNKIIKTQYS